MSTSTQPGDEAVLNSDLQQHLTEEYRDSYDQNNASRRIGEPIKVDNQNKDDADYLFCKMTVTVSQYDPGMFELKLINAPLDDKLRRTIYEGEAKVNYDERLLRADIFITATIKDAEYLWDLAAAYRSRIARGAKYPDPNWRWVCRRTADSLDRLADCICELDDEW